MDTFPKTGAAWTPVHEDKSPVIQGGVCSEINGKKSVHWIGRASEIADGGRKIKLPKGFTPVGYVVEAKPLEDPVGIYGTGVGLATGTYVTVKGVQQTQSTSGEYSNTSGGFAAVSGVVSGGTAAVMSGTTVTTPATDPNYGVVTTGALSGAMVSDEEQFVTLTATVSGVSGLDRAADDCVVDFRLWLDQTVPHPEDFH